MRTRSATLASAIVLAAVPAGLAIIGTPAPAHADSCAAADRSLPLDSGPCADVLAQEGRWLTVIAAGDVPTVESILAPGFMHTNSDGELLDRPQEMASIEKLPFTMNASEQLVNIAGDTAMIHGMNTLIQDDKVLARERFTDLFVLREGVWKALSVQETKL